MTRRKTTSEKWEEMIAEMRSSGKPEKTWCAEKGVSYYTMRGWVRKFSTEIYAKNKGAESASTNSEITWIEVRDDEKGKSPEEVSPIEIKIGKFTVEVPENFSSAVLSKACKVLEAIC